MPVANEWRPLVANKYNLKRSPVRDEKHQLRDTIASIGETVNSLLRVRYVLLDMERLYRQTITQDSCDIG